MNEIFNTVFENSLVEKSMNEHKAMVGFMDFEFMSFLPPDGVVMGGHPLFGLKEIFVNKTNIFQTIYKINLSITSLPIAKIGNPDTKELPFFISSYITKEEVKKITDKSVMKYINK